MVNRSRWKGAHDKFPAHVEEAKNSDGNVHRGYFLLEFRIAAELLRVGPMHSPEDYWAPSDWQLLLVVSEYMSALLEFLDWFWPDMGWEHHKQAIVLSKRLLQPRSPNTYPDLQIDPQLRAAWHSFTYCFWHGTRHLPAMPPSGEPAAAHKSAREWLTKLVGEWGFEESGHITSALQSWIQSTRPRLQEAFPNVDWSRWPTVVWPNPECAFRAVEKRGAIKRQQEEDYAVRWPLRVTQGRPKFNHLKLEARDGFVVGIPPVKNPPALSFLAVSDVICAFKQAAQHWPSAQPASSTYLAQQDVVQSFVQNVLRETRGPLAPGIAHEKYKYLGYVACSVLGWNSALAQLTLPVSETAAWGPQPLALAGGTAALMLTQQYRQQHEHQHQHQQHGLGLDGAHNAVAQGLNLGMGSLLLPVSAPLDLGMRVDLGLAAQLAMQPDLLMSPETEAALALRQPQAVTPQPLPQPPRTVTPPLPPPPPQQQPLLAAGASTAARAAATMAHMVQGFGSVPLPSPTAPNAVSVAPLLAGQASAPQGAALQQHRPDSQATRPRPSPFLARTCTASTSSAGAQSAGSVATRAESPTEDAQRQDGQGLCGVRYCEAQQAQQPKPDAQDGCGEVTGRAAEVAGSLDGPAPMSLGGLSSMQDLIDGLPSQADLTWSAILGAVAGEETGAEEGTGAAAGPPGAASELMAALPSLLLPSGLASASHPPPRSQPAQLQPHGCSHQQLSQGLGKQQAQPCDEGLLPPPTLVPGPLLAVQQFDSALPYGASLQPLPLPPTLLQAPDAPVLAHRPSRASSPCQATITTSALPSAVLQSLGLPSLALPSSGLSRPELSAGDSKFTRRSHGEVSTLSPMASCGPNGEVLPCSPATAGAAAGASTADDEAGSGGGTMASGSGTKSCHVGSLQRDRDAQAAVLSTGSRRTRQDVAAAAAAAAADLGLAPAPGSLVERSAKRPNAQKEPVRVSAVTAERVESLGAFLADQHVNLAITIERPGDLLQQQPPQLAGNTARSTTVANATVWAERDAVDKKALGRQLLRLLRAWAEEGNAAGQADDAYLAAAATAEVHRRAEELLERGAPVDATEDAEEAAAVATTAAGAVASADAAPPDSGSGSGACSGTSGYTALHWACLRGDVALAELLIRHGADPDCRDAAGTPARLVNPAFTATVTEVAARCGTRECGPAVVAAASNAHTHSQAPSSEFTSSSVTATAQATAADLAATQQSQLRNRLAELLRSADQVAAQLVLRDPQTAAGEVLRVMRDTDFLYPCIVSGGAASQ